jgi:hypothetical protein
MRVYVCVRACVCMCACVCVHVCVYARAYYCKHNRPRVLILVSCILPLISATINLFNSNIISLAQCTEGDVRLDTTGSRAGRVEFCHFGVWGVVCYSHTWNIHAAQVVCRQLGFSAAGKYLVKCMQSVHAQSTGFHPGGRGGNFRG